MKTKVICLECHQDDVTLDAIVYWNQEKQNWEVIDVAEPRAWCMNCQQDNEWDMVNESNRTVFAEWQAGRLKEAE